MNENQQFIYDALKGAGIEVGSPEDFVKGISSEDGAKWAFDTLAGSGVEVGDYNAYLSAIRPGPIAPQPVSKPGEWVKPQAPQQPADPTLKQFDASPVLNQGVPGVSKIGDTSISHLQTDMLMNEKFKTGYQDTSVGNTEQVKAVGDLKPAVELVGAPLITNKQPEKSPSFGQFIKATFDKVNAGGANMGASLAGFTENIYRTIGDVIPMFGYYDWNADQMAKLREFFKSDEMASRAKANIYKGKDFSALAKEGRYVDAAGEIFLTASESIPVSLTAFAGTMAGQPGLTFSLISAHGFQNKYDELKDEDMSEVMKGLNSIISGFSAAATEYLGSIPFAKWAQNTLRLGGEELLQKTLKNSLTKSVGDIFKRHGYLFEPVAEGLEEFTDAIVNNVADWATGRTDKLEPLKDAGKSFVYGAAGGAQFTAVAIPVQMANKAKVEKKFNTAQTALTDALIAGGYGQEEMQNLTRGLLEVTPEMAEQQIGYIAGLSDNPEVIGKLLVDFYQAGKEFEAISTTLQKDIQSLREQIAQKQAEKEAEIQSQTNKDTGEIQIVRLMTGEEVPLTAGKLAINPETGKITFMDSPDTYFYKDKDGKIKPLHLDAIDSLVSRAPASEVIAAEKERIAKTELGKVNYQAGQSVILMNQDGTPQMNEGQAVKTTIQAVDDQGVRLVTAEGQEILMSFDEADVLLAPATDMMPDLVGKWFVYEGNNVDVKGINEDGTYQVDLYDKDGNPVGTTKMAIEQLQAGKDPFKAEEEAKLLAEQQQNEGITPTEADKKIEVPVNKKGEVDYEQIKDPVVYNEGLKQEFGEESPAMLDELIAEAKDDLVKAQQKTNAIERKRATKQAQERLDMLETVKGLNAPAEAVPPVSTPAPELNAPAPEDTIVSERIAEITAEIESVSSMFPGAVPAVVLENTAAIMSAINAAGLKGAAFNNFKARIEGAYRTPGIQYGGIIYINAEHVTNDAVLTYVHEAVHVACRSLDVAQLEALGRNAANYAEFFPDFSIYAKDKPSVLGEEVLAFAVENMIKLHGIEALANATGPALSGNTELTTPLIAVLNILTDGKYQDQTGIGTGSGTQDVNPAGSTDIPGGTGERTSNDGRTEVRPVEQNREGHLYKLEDTVTYQGQTFTVAGVGTVETGELIYDLADESGKIVHEDVLQEDINTEVEENPIDKQINSQSHNDNPTENQKESGIYDKARVNIQGYNITIETRKGQQRSGTDSNGKKWSITMNNHYGELDGTKGYDGDPIDVFIGPNPDGQIFVVDQVLDGKFDESKVMLGFDSAEQAKEAYMSNFEKGWQGFGSITPAGNNFKQWLYDGAKQRKPFSEYKDTPDPEVTDVTAQVVPKAYRGKIKATKSKSELSANDIKGYVEKGVAKPLYLMDRTTETGWYRFDGADGTILINNSGEEIYFQAIDKRSGSDKMAAATLAHSFAIDDYASKDTPAPVEQAEQIPVSPDGLFQIYKSKIRRGEDIIEVYIVPSADNKGIDGMGSEIYNTLSEAIKAAETNRRDMADNERREAEAAAARKAAEEAEAARKEANKGKTLQQIANEKRTQVILEKQVSVNGVIKTRAQHIEDDINRGARFEVAQVKKIKDLTRSQYNRMNQREQDAFDKKQKDAGMKDEYRSYNPDGSYYEITKTEYDYAQKLIAERKAEFEAGNKETPEAVEAMEAQDKIGIMDFHPTYTDNMNALIKQAQENNEVFPLDKMSADERKIVDAAWMELLKNDPVKLAEERKRRILSNGTSFDKHFGLIHVSEIKTIDDVLSNIDKIVQSLKTNEGSGDFEGFAYGGKFAKNAGEQISGYLHQLDVLPENLLKGFIKKTGLTTKESVVKWVEGKYKGLQSTPTNQPEQQLEKAELSFNNWKWAERSLNAIVITPNAVGKAFTAEEFSQLMEWAKANDFTPLRDARPTRIELVTPQIINNELRDYLNSVSITGVREKLAAEKKQREEDKKKSEAEKVATRESYNWIVETFGEGAINTYNTNALADFLEGKAKKFEGQVSPKWLDGITKLGAFTPDGKGVDFDKLKAAYQSSKEQPAKTEPAKSSDFDPRTATTEQWAEHIQNKPKTEVSFPDFRRSLDSKWANEEKTRIAYTFNGRPIGEFNSDLNNTGLRSWYNNWQEGKAELPAPVQAEPSKAVQEKLTREEYESFDMRGYSFAILTDKGIATSGSYPSLANSPKPVKYYLDLAAKYNGRLFIAPTDMSDIKQFDNETRILGLTWSQIQSAQMGKYSPELVRSAMPKGAVEFPAYPETGQPVQAEPSKAVQEKLEDYGEKVEGARKDQARKYYDKINLNGMTLSTIFPKPDVKDLVDAGVPLRQAAAIKVAHEFAVIDSKKKSKGSKIGNIKFYAAYAKGLLADNLNLEFSDSGYTFTDYGKSQIQLRAAAYEKVANELGMEFLPLDLSKVKISEVHEMYRKMMVNVPKEAKFCVQYYVNSSKYFETEARALDEFVAQVKANTKVDAPVYKRKIHIYRNRQTGKSYVGYQPSSGEFVKLSEDFNTSLEASEFKKSHEAELHTELERIMSERRSKSATTAVRLKFTNETARERVGKDWREGENVNAEKFATTFGFRAVEFGNWVNQKERQAFVNNTFDSLMDMAQLLGVSPKALSMGGKLAVSFGARGSGSATAHYEPANLLISLTKTKGMGSLAHEWFHSMDNFFAGFKYNDKDMFSATAGSFKEGVRPEIMEAFKRISSSFPFGFSQRSRMLDLQRSKRYFALTDEMSARAFETYILTRLTESGQVNDFLANYTPESDWAGKPDNYPYPTAEEIPAIRKAFDDFFATVEEDAEAVMFRMIGEKGAANLDKAEEATIRLDNLRVAREMEATKTPKEIRMATGWERGVEFISLFKERNAQQVLDYIENLGIIKKVPC